MALWNRQTVTHIGVAFAGVGSSLQSKFAYNPQIKLFFSIQKSLFQSSLKISTTRPPFPERISCFIACYLLTRKHSCTEDGDQNL